MGVSGLTTADAGRAHIERMTPTLMRSALAAMAGLSLACGPRSEVAVHADSLSVTPKPGPPAVAAAPADSAPGAAASPRGVLGQYDLAGEPGRETKLPHDLDEISGLAFSGDGRLFAHGDQDATIWQLDAKNG